MEVKTHKVFVGFVEIFAIVKLFDSQTFIRACKSLNETKKMKKF